MTIKEKIARRKRLLAKLRDEIREILEHQRKPLSLPEIEFYLKAERMAHGESIDAEAVDTFAVRDAVSEMINVREAEYRPGREVELIRK
jgi:regulator of RNase E activity RraB